MSKYAITWWEIQASDLEQAKAFYGGLFGWTFRPWKDNYEIASVGEDMVCGMAQVDGDPAGRYIHVVFSADVYGDTLEAMVDRVSALGGTVQSGRTLIAPEMGWYATVTDPSGLSFDLWTGKDKL
jgi:uncharacterized protein